MFGGWYYVTEENVQAAEAAAAAGAWETLYKLFAGKFSGNSAVAEEDSQITVYAKWNEPAPTPSGDPWEPTPTPRPTPAAAGARAGCAGRYPGSAGASRGSAPDRQRAAIGCPGTGRCGPEHVRGPVCGRNPAAQEREKRRLNGP